MDPSKLSHLSGAYLVSSIASANPLVLPIAAGGHFPKELQDKVKDFENYLADTQDRIAAYLRRRKEIEDILHQTEKEVEILKQQMNQNDGVYSRIRSSAPPRFDGEG